MVEVSIDMAGQYDIIIIGGGISGLSLAHYCAKAGMATLIAEKSERLGGAFHSHRLSTHDGYWLELGAHTCYNTYQNLIGIIEDCGALPSMVAREKVSFRMLIGDRIASIPSQLNFAELLISAPKILTLSKKGLTLRSYYEKIVGRKNYERVFSPAFNAVVSQPADDFPADGLFKKRGRRKDILKKYTFSGGLQTATDKISRQQGIDTRTGVSIKSVNRAGKGFTIVAEDGLELSAKHLAVAAPASEASAMLASSFPELAGLLASIKIVHISSVGVIVKKETVSLKPFAGLVPKDDCFYSVVSRDTVDDPSYRGFTFHFRPDVSEEKEMKRICSVLGTKREKIEDISRRKNLLPSLKETHYGLVEKIDSLTRGAGLLLTGNYFYGIAIEDCVCRSLSESRRLFASIA